MLGEEFNNLVIKVDSYYQTNSLNYLIIRNKPYNEKERFQSEEQSKRGCCPSFYFRILSSVFPRIFSFALSLISRFFILAISDLMCSGFE